MPDRKALMCILILIAWQAVATACPNCVGAATNKSAPFFSDECYQYSSKQIENQSPESRQEDRHES